MNWTLSLNEWHNQPLNTWHHFHERKMRQQTSNLFQNTRSQKFNHELCVFFGAWLTSQGKVERNVSVHYGCVFPFPISMLEWLMEAKLGKECDMWPIELGGWGGSIWMIDRNKVARKACVALNMCVRVKRSKVAKKSMCCVEYVCESEKKQSCKKSMCCFEYVCESQEKNMCISLVLFWVL